MSKPVHAASTAALGVQPVQSAYQRDKHVTYFDLLLKAGQSTPVQVKLTNSSNKAIKVNVAATAATTSDTGIVDYTGHSNAADATLAHKMSDALKGATAVTVPAKGSQTYSATLSMPSTAFSGVMVGGLVFTPANQSTSTSGKLGVVSKYAYTVAVLARNSDTILTPKLAVGTIKSGRIKRVNQIQATLRNTTAAFANHIEAITQIKAPDGSTKTLRLADAQMAPNSQLNQVYSLGTKVKAGDYQVTTTAYWGKSSTGAFADGHGNNYQYRTNATKTVKITQAQAAKLTQAAAKVNSGLPTAYIIAIVVGIILLVLIIALLIALIVRRKKAAQKLAALEKQVSDLKNHSNQ
ncbi:DUF916 domain-containing protein [Lacticaseibacillus sp. N501-2]|uniref:DUF916 domain-containing protein n=1 Tax=Lacticaseibacillus salsurae TaxID=3367729 RepID=UPI0038B2F4DC